MEKITYYFNQRLLIMIKGNAAIKPTKGFDEEFSKQLKKERKDD